MTASTSKAFRRIIAWPILLGMGSKVRIVITDQSLSYGPTVQAAFVTNAFEMHFKSRSNRPWLG
jgi:hypothetical protein